MLIVTKIDNMVLIFCYLVLVNIKLPKKQQNQYSHWQVISQSTLCLRLTKISIGFHTVITLPTGTSASKATIFSGSSNINKQEIILQFYVQTISEVPRVDPQKPRKERLSSVKSSSAE